MGDFKELLGEIDRYVEELFATNDEALEKTLRGSKDAGLPEIQVSPNQGKLLRLLAEISGARRILEIGTLGGYSAIHFARALPESGTLISLEVDERHAEVARKNIQYAGLDDRVEVQVGDAHDRLTKMVESGVEPFDLIFIDAEKEGYPAYLERALELSRPGSLILADNTIRGGSVLEPENESARATQEYNECIANHPKLTSIILPLIRERIDGIAISRVLGD
ncbi:O-methyltransferase [soil metagenome]|jgi:predicted O-methyltransferase YrrM